MCGFVGVVAINQEQPLPKSLLDPALRALAARGPDSIGSYEFNENGLSLLLGHRRLKIIDLTDAANQPFCIDDLVMVFNGEIYNYLELRIELEVLGRIFSTTSDTEVLLHAFACWGNSCFARLEGAFAVAIFDRTAQKVVLARDRFGEKPLYYCTQGNRLSFGSTLDALTATVCDLEKSIDVVNLRNFLILGYVPAPDTARVGIKKLKPGYILSFSLPSLQQTEYSFGFNSAQFSDCPEVEQFNINTFESLLVSSLEKRFRSDLPVVLLMSGGIDSTYLACLAKRVLNRSFRAITITDDLDESPETRRAQQACEILDIPHTLVRINSVKLNQQGVWFLRGTDEVAGDPAFPVLCELFAATPKDAVVFLTGDGADELFLSYSNYARFLRENKKQAGAFLGNLILMLSSWMPRFAFIRCLPRVVSEPGCRLRLALESEFRRHGLAAAIPPHVAKIGDGIGGLYRYSIEFELPEYLLYKTDRASMLFSKEARAPFLDTALFNYMLTRSWNRKCLGSKEALGARINYYLGRDLNFRKRGMAAGGQKGYRTPIKDVASVYCTLAKSLPMLDGLKLFVQLLTNRLARFRMLAIHAWLSKQ